MDEKSVVFSLAREEKTPYNMEKTNERWGPEWNRNEWIRSITI